MSGPVSSCLPVSILDIEILLNRDDWQEFLALFFLSMRLIEYFLQVFLIELLLLDRFQRHCNY